MRTLSSLAAVPGFHLDQARHWRDRAILRARRASRLSPDKLARFHRKRAMEAFRLSLVYFRHWRDLHQAG